MEKDSIDIKLKFDVDSILKTKSIFMRMQAKYMNMQYAMQSLVDDIQELEDLNLSYVESDKLKYENKDLGPNE